VARAWGSLRAPGCAVLAPNPQETGTPVDPAWQRAVEGGDAERVRALLEAGADVDARDRHGQTALMLAAHRGHRRVVEALLERAPRLDVTARLGLSALMLAVVAGHEEIARLLVGAGADRSLRGTGAPGFAGRTAGDLARDRGLHALARELEPDRQAPAPAGPARRARVASRP